MTKSKKVVVMGDAHIDDTQNLRRFKSLNAYLNFNEPDELVIIGDFLTMNCLSDWDRNKRMKMEGKRYQKEIAAGNLALDYTTILTPSKMKITYVKGNHENRLDRYLEVDPTFAGQVSIEKDLKLRERGIKVVEYKDNYNVNGVSFTHIPIMGNGKPIGGPNIARKALSLYHNSVVFGHAHTLDHAAEHRQNAPHLNQALCCGCFFEHTEDYAVGSKTDYWRGLVELNIYANNRFDFKTISMSELLKNYG